MQLYLGNGDGTFQPPVSISNAGGNAVVAGDFNGDGKADLAVVSAGFYRNINAIASFASLVSAALPAEFSRFAMLDLDLNT